MSPDLPAPGRRPLLLDAAVRVLAAQGARGLTHRAVDREAGVGEGSTSAYLRTRRALTLALAQHVTGLLAADVDNVVEDLAGCPAGDPRTSALVQALLERWLTERTLLLAKVELTLEAARDPEVAVLLQQARDRVVRVVADVLAGRVEDPGAAYDLAEALTTSLDGILLAALVRPEAERAAYLAQALERTLHPLGPSAPPAAAAASPSATGLRAPLA